MLEAMKALGTAFDSACHKLALIAVGLIIGLAAYPMADAQGYIKPKCTIDKGLYDLATGENVN